MANFEIDEKKRQELQEEFIHLAKEAKAYFGFEEEATKEGLSKMLNKMKSEENFEFLKTIYLK